MGSDQRAGEVVSESHPLRFEMPGCFKHFRRNRWWCRRCHREVESQFREVAHALWELQGADRVQEVEKLRRDLHNQSFVLKAWKGHHDALHATCDAYGPGLAEQRRG
jgi:hypothetical protein